MITNALIQKQTNTNNCWGTRRKPDWTPPWVSLIQLSWCCWTWWWSNTFPCQSASPEVERRLISSSYFSPTYLFQPMKMFVLNLQTVHKYCLHSSPFFFNSAHIFTVHIICSCTLFCPEIDPKWWKQVFEPGNKLF